MPSLPRLLVRDARNQSSNLTPTMVTLLIALLIILIVGILAIIALLVLRSRRTRQRYILQSQAEKITASTPDLPTYSLSPRSSHKPSHRRLTITAAPYGRNSKPIFSVSEKEVLMGDSPTTSPIPEIRITFPEEEDEMGKRQSGRVVVVKVSDLGGVGLEPLGEKQGLPAYEGEGWKELDLEQIGGLKEKVRQ